MHHRRVLILAGTAFWTATTGCTTKDSLLDAAGSSGAGAPAAGATAATGGTAPANGGTGAGAGQQSSGGLSASGGSSTGGGKGGTGGTSGTSATSGDSGSTADAGDGATSGNQNGGSAGSTGATGGSAGTGVGGGGGGGGGGGNCAEVTTLEECEARADCHSVFEDPGTCGCASVGCCAHFDRCADGDKADCQGASVQCDVATPFCEKPAYVVSAAGSCYEGCVDPKDCATVCTAPDDPSGCACYSDADCTGGTRCYSADCANEITGSCRTPPSEGCFGDQDCSSGQTCIGGHPAPCNTTLADQLGTCGVEECRNGDCPGPAGASCTCSDGSACAPATGPTGSGLCRADDGTCSACKCAAPDTPIATPDGERAIAELVPGDLVYSVDGAEIRAVPLLRINRTPVMNHRVLHVTFDNGRSIDMTAGHPLADGRPLSSLRPGTELLGGTVLSVASVPYQHAATYDILPDSTSGAYFASSVLIGSTLAGAATGQAASCQPPTTR